MPDHNDFERVTSDLDRIDGTVLQLKSALENLHSEMLNNRVETASNQMQYMRVWLGLFTATVTLVLAITGFFGYRSFSDIQANRKTVEEKAAEVTSIVNGAEATLKGGKEALDHVAAMSKQVDGLIGQNKNKMDGFDASIRDFDSKLTALQTQYDDLHTRTNQIGQGLSGAFALATSAQSSTTFLGSDLSAFATGNPAIFTGPLVSQNSGTLLGAFFGGETGHLYVRVAGVAFQPLSSGGTTVIGMYGGQSQPITSDPLELDKASIVSWSDNSIGYSLSEPLSQSLNKKMVEVGAKLKDQNLVAPNIYYEFMVETKSGAQSSWYSCSPLKLTSTVGLSLPATPAPK